MNKKTSKTLFSSAKDDWGTPDWLFKLLDEEFHFDLDAAAQEDECEVDFQIRYRALQLKLELQLSEASDVSADAIGKMLEQQNEVLAAMKPFKANFKCERYFTKADNALTQPWRSSTVWVNPPYGRGIGRWTSKAKREVQLSDSTVVMLVAARTDTKWFWDHCVHGASEIRLLKGRLRFEGAKHAATFPSAIVVFRPYDQYEPMAGIYAWDPPRPGEQTNSAEENDESSS